MKDKILIPSGIGDALWILQTLPQDKAYYFEITKSDKYRAWQLLDLLPSLVDGYNEHESISFSYNDKRITQANRHVENGQRIERFTGTCTWDLPWQTKQYKTKANKLLKKPRGKKLIGIYTSSFRHAWVQRNYTWQADDWLRLLNTLSKNDNVKLALFGADYDKDASEWLKGKGVDFVDCVGDQHLGVTIEAIKKCDGFIGFPSGLPIIAHHLKVPTIMFFPHEARHTKMHNTFNRPGSIEDGTWKGCSFPKLVDLLEWMQNSKVWAEMI